MSLYDDLPPVGSEAADEIPNDLNQIAKPQETETKKSATEPNQREKKVLVTEEWTRGAQMFQNAISRKKQQQQKKSNPFTTSAQTSTSRPPSAPKKMEVIEAKPIFDNLGSSQTPQSTQAGSSIFGTAQIQDPYDPMKPNDYEDILDERVGLAPRSSLFNPFFMKVGLAPASGKNSKKSKVELSYKKNEAVQKMMGKMGFQEGFGLGRENQGRTTPLALSKSGEIK